MRMLAASNLVQETDELRYRPSSLTQQMTQDATEGTLRAW